MTVETALYPSQLNPALPFASDMVSEGDDHIRLLKTVDKTTWGNVAGAVSASHIELNYIVGVTSPLQGQINGKGAITGQTWTGAHVFNGSIAVPTLAQATSTTGAASTAFVQNEWVTRLPNYTGPITASTAELNRMVGVTSGVQAQINAKATRAGDTYTGTHDFSGATSITAPTRTTGDATTNVATTAFVAAAALSTALPGQAGNAGKVITTDGTNASWTSVLTGPLSVPAGASGAQAPRASEVPVLARTTMLHEYSNSSMNGVALDAWKQYSIDAGAVYARPLGTSATNGDRLSLINHGNTWVTGNFTVTIPSGSLLFVAGNQLISGPNTLVLDSDKVEKIEFTCISTNGPGLPVWVMSIS